MLGTRNMPALIGVRLGSQFLLLGESYDDTPEFRYGKFSDCLTTGIFFRSCGLRSWKRVHDKVTRNVLLDKNVALPGC
jgi:hypothetical protein